MFVTLQKYEKKDKSEKRCIFADGKAVWGNAPRH
jgi:hypothetical protein